MRWLKRLLWTLGMGTVIASGIAGCRGPVEIRFKNASVQSFDSVEVNFGQSVQFGALPAGAMTDYQRFDDAYSYGYVRVTVGNDEYIIQPIDYVGEVQLEAGKYTHTLEITGAPGVGGLTGTTTKDP